MIRRTLLAVLLALTACAGALAVELSRDGVRVARLVVAPSATPAERFAAEELSRHLEEMTGVEWPIDDAAGASGAELHVGPTGAPSLADEAFGAEEWLVEVGESRIVLTGGRPRGTLYAVYEFLERELGVRWWTPFDSSVPRHRDLAVAPVARRGRPALAYRDVEGLKGPLDFRARHRVNGHLSFLGPARGGRESYGPPFHVHTFYMHAPPDELFAEHPEFYSEIDGVRTADRGQLCLTNVELVDAIARRIAERIADAEGEARRTGEPPPRTYGLSQNDWGGPCECERCRAAVARTGSQSGVLLEFVNAVARRVGARHPDVLIDTLAYEYTLDAPTQDGLLAAPNVVLRVAGLRPRDFLRPATHRRNRVYFEALREWRPRVERLRVWDYAVTYGWRPNNFPLPNWSVLGADVKSYVELGVDGIFLQHSHPILGDLRDLKLWVALQLVADPGRDAEQLVREFVEGFYGPAAPAIREYLERLNRKARRRGTAIRFPTEAEHFTYLDAGFLVRAHGLFDRAERSVANRPELVLRVREARISLDRATLWLWSDRFGDRRTIEHRRLAAALEPESVAARLRQSARGRIERYFGQGSWSERQAALDDEIGGALDRLLP